MAISTSIGPDEAIYTSITGGSERHNLELPHEPMYSATWGNNIHHSGATPVSLPWSSNSYTDMSDVDES